jgi:ankyrin repeat protein
MNSISNTFTIQKKRRMFYEIRQKMEGIEYPRSAVVLSDKPSANLNRKNADKDISKHNLAGGFTMNRKSIFLMTALMFLVLSAQLFAMSPTAVTAMPTAM